MADSYSPYPLPPCPDPIPDPAPEPCPDWTICLPFGGRLYARSGCVYADPGNPPADGVYGGLVVSGGCIAGVIPREACLENLAPCVENPPTCYASVGAGDNTGGGTTSQKTTIVAGDNVTVTGTGTSSNPYVIAAQMPDSIPTYLIASTDAISLTGRGSYANPYNIAHKTGLQGTYNGMVFDRYGHLVGTSPKPTTAAVTSVLGTNGIKTEISGTGVVTVSPSEPAKKLAGTHLLGGYNVTLDSFNRITDINQEVLAPAGRYALGAYDVVVNNQGSITDVVAGDLGANYIFTWPAGKMAAQRGAAFTLRFPTALAGTLITNGEEDFWNGLSIVIDEIPCKTGWPLFWSNGSFMPGQHLLMITADVPWPATVGAVLHLFSLSHADNVYETEYDADDEDTGA